jgi:hypothetical protein
MNCTILVHRNKKLPKPRQITPLENILLIIAMYLFRDLNHDTFCIIINYPRI